MDMENMQSFAIPGGNYGYTGTTLPLTNFAYCLGQGLVDESGSTKPFARQLELTIKEIVKSLRHSPAQDSVLYRHCHFDTDFREIHGFKLLQQINEDDYDGCWAGGGRTHLYDSVDRVLAELQAYAHEQAAKKYTVNGLLYVLTDGQDYQSNLHVADVQKRLASLVVDEDLESLITILIGVNGDDDVQRSLEKFSTDAGFSKYIPAEEANEKTLARIGNFVSQQLISQSQHAGSGGPSQILTF